MAGARLSLQVGASLVLQAASGGGRIAFPPSFLRCGTLC